MRVAARGRRDPPRHRRASGRYCALASDLVNARCTVVALDLPGHGESRVPAATCGPGRRARSGGRRDVRRARRASRAAGVRAAGVCSAIAWAGSWRSTTRSRVRAASRPRSSRARRSRVRCRRGGSSRSRTSRVPLLHGGISDRSDSSGEGGVSRDPEVMKHRDADRLVHDRISPRLYFDFEEARQRVCATRAGFRSRRCCSTAKPTAWSIPTEPSRLPRPLQRA